MRFSSFALRSFLALFSKIAGDFSYLLKFIAFLTGSSGIFSDKSITGFLMISFFELGAKGAGFTSVISIRKFYTDFGFFSLLVLGFSELGFAVFSCDFGDIIAVGFLIFYGATLLFLFLDTGYT